MPCPDANVLSSFAEGRLDARAREQVELHIDQCAECAELVAELVAERDQTDRGGSEPNTDGDVSELATRVEGEAGGSSPTPLAPSSGTFGRYLVIELLGTGGMGQVYVAYDPELDRRVALKVVRADLKDRTEGTGGSARLLREAQAAASLSHPNVVTIHDVGAVDGQVFIAMELIDGQPLGAWQTEPDRSWREILAIYRQAGEGLAAAHAAKLLHRDFKPDNVLVGRDGIARVLDFGLAKPTEASEVHEDFRIERARVVVPDDLTQAGAVVGTPAYMAPEQLRGDEVDARADQFSFCVALWEALVGKRPFTGANMRELFDSVAAGRLDEDELPRKLPSWLLKILRRGLAKDREQRFDSMRTLLDELDRHPRRRSQLGLIGLAVAAAAAVATLGYVQGRSREPAPAPACVNADAPAREVWSAARRAAIAEAFATTELSYAPRSWASTAESIDGYVERWRASRVATCEATRVDATQSERLLELRTRCLDRRLGELDALLELLADPDPSLVERAPQAVAALPDLSSCADIDSLERIDALPDDPSLRARIDAAFTELDRVNALALAARYDEAAELAEQLAGTAEQLDYAPLRAAAVYGVGDMHDRLGDPKTGEAELRRALTLAEASGDDVTATKAWTALIYIVGLELARPDEGRFMADYAAAKLARLDAQPALRRKIHSNLAMLEYGAGDFDAATREVEAAIEIAERDEPNPLVLQQLLDILGSLERQRGRPEAARDAFARGLELASDKLGPDHPALASSHGNLSAALFSESRYAEARHHAERALELSRASAPESPFVAAALNNLANIHAAMDQHQQALELHEQALALREAIFGRDNPEVAQSLDNIGNALTALDRPGEALIRHQQALAIRERVHGPEHPWTAYSHMGIGVALLELGEAEQAASALELALARLDQPEGADPVELGDAQFALARALASLGREPERVASLFGRARENLSTDPERIAKLDDWHRAHLEQN